MKSKDNQHVLNAVLPRIWQPNSTDTAELALEVKDGPYTGVVFGFTKFDVQEDKPDSKGLVPVKFDTTIYQSPEGFVKDESFDAFTAEILIAWLEYIVGEAPKGE